MILNSSGVYSTLYHSCTENEMKRFIFFAYLFLFYADFKSVRTQDIQSSEDYFISIYVP
jgi:hypothetical protein